MDYFVFLSVSDILPLSCMETDWSKYYKHVQYSRLHHTSTVIHSKYSYHLSKLLQSVVVNPMLNKQCVFLCSVGEKSEENNLDFCLCIFKMWPA